MFRDQLDHPVLCKDTRTQHFKFHFQLDVPKSYNGVEIVNITRSEVKESSGAYREVQLELTPEIEVFHMLLDRCPGLTLWDIF